MPENDKYDLHFYQLVISLHAAGMQQMGKVASPLTGKVERDLAMAQSSIDMLAMIQRKSQGNLNEDEKKLLDHALYELRINYVDEVKKGDGQPKTAPENTADEGKPPEQSSEKTSETKEAETEENADNKG